jgi:hypothetical protein
VAQTVTFMINPLNLPPLVGPAGTSPLAPAPRASSAGATSAASWFDPATVSADVCISADLDPASRGLSVAQHAARVLQHLCGERDAGP